MDLSKLHLTKVTGALVTVFGAIQLMAPQFQAVLSPTIYFWFTLLLGIVVTILGRLKMSGDGFLSRNKTWVTGVLLIAFSVVQEFSPQLKDALTPQGFALFTIIVGIGIAVLGVLNSMGGEDPPAPPPTI